MGGLDVNDPDRDPLAADDEQWDDAAVAAATQGRSKGVKADGSAADGGGVLDMKSLDTKRGGQNNIKEKLRVEETRAQLAAAREGMERQAAKLKEEQEKKEQVKKEAAMGRFPGASASLAAGGGLGGTGGKWVPPHMRGGGGTSVGLSSVRMGGGKLDVQDEELFPDLSAAGKILEQKEKDLQPVYKVAKKTPVGGGATWASRPQLKLTPKTEAPAPAPAPSSKPDAKPPAVGSVQESEAKPSPTAATSSKTAAATTPTVKPTKKKKKDLSTFKPVKS